MRSRHRETSGVHARAYPTRNRHPLLVSMLGWLNAAFGSSRAAGRGTRGGTRGDGDAVRDADATRAPGESSTSGSPTGAFRGSQSCTDRALVSGPSCRAARSRRRPARDRVRRRGQRARRRAGGCVRADPHTQFAHPNSDRPAGAHVAAPMHTQSTSAVARPPARARALRAVVEARVLRTPSYPGGSGLP